MTGGRVKITPTMQRLLICQLSTPSRVHCLQRVFTINNSFNRTYCIQDTIRKESRDWKPPELRKLYEDDWVLAISKPGSLLVHKSKDASKEEKKQKAFLKDLVEVQYNQGRPLFTVHRLDRGASGVILFAKCSISAHAAQLALAHEDTVKEYLVLARGSTPDSFICDDPVKDDKGIPRSAWTNCEKLLDLPKSHCSLLKVHIKTGRWHQIRKHLNHKAFHVSPPKPFLVIGDGRHGKGKTNQYFRDNYQMPLGRCFLHAARLTIPHPSIFAALCTNKLLPMGGLETVGIMKPDIQSEHVGKDLLSFMNTESRYVPLNTRKMLQIDYCPKVLTLRASFPRDLRRVLLALPDGLSSEFLGSFDCVV